MYNSQEIANRIKIRAKAQGCPISSVLAACGLGKNTVFKISQGTDILTLNFAKIADYLDCSVDYLLGRTNNPEVSDSTEDVKSKKHDKAGQHGFDVKPELLAHELAMLMLSKHEDIQKMTANELYDAYTKSLHDIETEIGERIRYDSLFDK